MPKRAKSGPLRVVVADDDAGFAELLATIVDASERCEVVGIAADGEEALQLSIWQDADVVLMDIDMPKIDGLRAMHLLRKSRPRACVLFVSGLEDERADEARAAGAFAYIPKSRAVTDVERMLRVLEGQTEATG
jgi:two-component system chemotaxis response regulator CheB